MLMAAYSRATSPTATSSLRGALSPSSTSPVEGRRMERRVRLYVGQVYEDRDKSFIPGYVRTICEYDAAYAAAKRVLDEGGSPIVLMDGSLYIGRFPYAMREYRHHPELLVRLLRVHITAAHARPGQRVPPRRRRQGLLRLLPLHGVAQGRGHPGGARKPC